MPSALRNRTDWAESAGRTGSSGEFALPSEHASLREIIRIQGTKRMFPGASRSTSHQQTELSLLQDVGVGLSTELRCDGGVSPDRGLPRLQQAAVVLQHAPRELGAQRHSRRPPDWE